MEQQYVMGYNYYDQQQHFELNQYHLQQLQHYEQLQRAEIINAGLISNDSRIPYIQCQEYTTFHNNVPLNNVQLSGFNVQELSGANLADFNLGEFPENDTMAPGLSYVSPYFASAADIHPQQVTLTQEMNHQFLTPVSGDFNEHSFHPQSLVNGGMNSDELLFQPSHLPLVVSSPQSPLSPLSARFEPFESDPLVQDMAQFHSSFSDSTSVESTPCSEFSHKHSILPSELVSTPPMRRDSVFSTPTRGGVSRVSSSSKIEKKRSLSKVKESPHTSQPGPIPASPPQLGIDPVTGEELLIFFYSRQKVITKFVLKCPPQLEFVDIKSMPLQFLEDNSIYPKAMVPQEEYKGNRGNYERECNRLGWKLCWLNPHIRGQRGLIQRAVDSWRNTRMDVKVRSRRVRKQVKMYRKQSLKVAKDDTTY